MGLSSEFLGGTSSQIRRASTLPSSRWLACLLTRLGHYPLRVDLPAGGGYSYRRATMGSTLVALFEILEFAERKGLRADKQFLSRYPLKLTSFRSFLGQELESE